MSGTHLIAEWGIPQHLAVRLAQLLFAEFLSNRLFKQCILQMPFQRAFDPAFHCGVLVDALTAGFNVSEASVLERRDEEN